MPSEWPNNLTDEELEATFARHGDEQAFLCMFRQLVKQAQQNLNTEASQEGEGAANGQTKGNYRGHGRNHRRTEPDRR
jgi:hypothetical protein